MRKNTFIVGLLVLLLSGFALTSLIAQEPQTDAEANYSEDIGDMATMNWTTKVLSVKGNGYGPERVKQLGRRKILAKRAARLDAYRNMVEAIKGVQVTSNTSVKDMVVEIDTIKTKTDGLLKGARLVDVTYSNDGGCEVTMEVNIDRNGKFLLNALNTDKVGLSDNYPKFDWVAVQKKLTQTQSQLANSQSQLTQTKSKLANSQSQLIHSQSELVNSQSDLATTKEELLTKTEFAKNNPGQSKPSNQPVKTLPVAAPPKPEVKKDYSGLLVDARGLGLKPILAPAILNSKKEKMYGLGVIPTKVRGGSIADYLPGNIEHAKKYKKIFDWPLVVKGIDVINDSDVVISEEDAEKMKLILHLLERSKVVILI